MRSSTILAVALSAIGASAAAVGKQVDQPACVTKCWANSQYVSNCAGNQQCLCDDSEFQNAMYQCLYSQCQTAQFGVALHHALGLCSEEQLASSATAVPAIVRQGGDLRKRGNALQSNSVAYTRTSSRATATTTRGQASVSASAYMTYSTARASASVLSVAPSAVSVKASGPIYMTTTVTMASPTSTPDVIMVTVTEMVSATATPTVVSQISDGQIQASASAITARAVWDSQRFPASS